MGQPPSGVIRHSAERFRVRVNSLCPLGKGTARRTALLDLNAHYHALNTHWLHRGLVLRNSSETAYWKKFGKRFDAVRYHAAAADTDHYRQPAHLLSSEHCIDNGTNDRHREPQLWRLAASSIATKYRQIA